MRLTDSQVKDLKAGFLAGLRPAELGKQYGVSVATVYKYLQGRSRKGTGDADLLQPQNRLEVLLTTHPGEILKGIRGLLALTQAEFAREMGKSASTIGNWETGETQMRLTDRRRLTSWLTDKGLMPSVKAMIEEGNWANGEDEDEDMADGDMADGDITHPSVGDQDAA